MDEHNHVQEEQAEIAGNSKGRDRITLAEIRQAYADRYPPIIKINEAAEIARLAVSTMRRLVSEGRFKASVRWPGRSPPELRSLNKRKEKRRIREQQHRPHPRGRPSR